MRTCRFTSGTWRRRFETESAARVDGNAVTLCQQRDMETPGQFPGRAFPLTWTGEKVRQVDFGSPGATLAEPLSASARPRRPRRDRGNALTAVSSRVLSRCAPRNLAKGPVIRRSPERGRVGQQQPNCPSARQSPNSSAVER